MTLDDSRIGQCIMSEIQTETCWSNRIQVRMMTNGVAEVCLNRPDKMNALDTAMFDGMLQAGEQLTREADLRAVVLHGAGRAFCAGLDMGSFSRMAEGGSPGDGLADLVARSHGLTNRAQQVAWQWRELAVPVVAAIHGAAFGGGLQVALGADVRYVGADAKLSVMEIKWGLVPDMAGIPLLRQLLRSDVVRELVYSGRIVESEEACRLGLATAISADPLAQARSFAHGVAQRNPDAIRAAKRLLNRWSDDSDKGLLLAESVEQKALIGSTNQQEAVNAELARRVPIFIPST